MQDKDLLSYSDTQERMLSYWNKVNDIASGVDALRTPVYLPRFPAESDAAYKYRLSSSVLVNVFIDIITSIAAKPFTREVGVRPLDNPLVMAFVEDIDTQGNHIHILAQYVFYKALLDGVVWMMIDYPQANGVSTLAEERLRHSRPYVVVIEAKRVLEVRSEVINGTELFTYLRVNESTGDRELVREYAHTDNGVVWTLSEKVTDDRDGEKSWEVIDEGSLSIGVIPLVPLFTGRRIPGTWEFTFPYQSMADLQIEHFIQETNLKIAKQHTAFPMLAGEGISPPLDKSGKPVSMPVGPSTVLYAPMNSNGQHGSWKVVEPSTSSLIFLAQERDKTEEAMRTLGRQMAAAGSAGITQTAAAYMSQNANSALQAYVFNLKDALEKCLRYMCTWAGIDLEPEILINTDFGITLGEAGDTNILVELYKEGAISRHSLMSELKRKGVLSAEYNIEEDVVTTQGLGS